MKKDAYEKGCVFILPLGGLSSMGPKPWDPYVPTIYPIVTRNNLSITFCKNDIGPLVQNISGPQPSPCAAFYLQQFVHMSHSLNSLKGGSPLL